MGLAARAIVVHTAKGASSMASVPHPLRDWGIDEAAHPVLVKSFKPDEVRHQIEDDLFAGKSVSIELTVVVGIGLFLGALAVLYSL
jgi:hypothetical protein